MADIVSSEASSGTSTPPQLTNGWNNGASGGSPARGKKDMELKQRAGYPL